MRHETEPVTTAVCDVINTVAASDLTLEEQRAVANAAADAWAKSFAKPAKGPSIWVVFFRWLRELLTP